MISVVIPVLNEERALPDTLRHLAAVPEIKECLVVDGGSTDATIDVAKKGGARIVIAPRGRGQQLNHGLNAAREEIVLLLHADTWLRGEAGRACLKTLNQPGVVAGGFYKQFRDPPTWLMRGSRFRCWLRLILFQRVLGDQGFFARRTDFAAIGGIPEMALMEEFEMCRRFARLGRLALAPCCVSTSTRRFEKFGVMRTYWMMAKVTALYYAGRKPEALRAIYENAPRSE